MRKKFFYVWLLFLVTSGAIAQNTQVTGKITDEKGVPITGVSVVEKKTKKGTSTGIDGNFTLSVPAGATLLISYVGFEKREIVANSSQPLTIALKPLNQSLSEVVVTALG
ncbi:MAG: carboxypeptidase-like regulatory domain-containing protein, partial [Bacteroidetes bacterium]|nr:carboxypeptidase-like regulatory domain-containing protein [Bacteroidota bacterium]